MIFSNRKVYELALSTIKKEFINDFLSKYIKAVVPLMNEYGGKFLLTGMITQSIGNKLPVRNFALLEWPSVKSFISINDDDRINDLMILRNKYIEFINEGVFYNLNTDITFEIPSTKKINLLLTNRSPARAGTINFKWINSPQNSELTQNMFLSGANIHQFNEKEDFEGYEIQLN